MIIGRNDPQPASTGSLILAARGIRHTFASPSDKPARVLGLWSPGSALTLHGGHRGRPTRSRTT